jgi:hypothetical protein
LPHVERPGNPWRKYVSPEYFAAKYANASTDELQAARATLRETFLPRMSEAGKVFLDSGLGETRVTPRPTETEDFVMPPGEDLHGLISGQRTEVTTSGELLIQSGLLSWEANISLYDSQDELHWLSSEIIRRGRLPAPDKAAETSGAANK